MHIPPEHILPQDMVDIVDHGPPDPGPQPEGDDLAWKIRAAEYENYKHGPLTLRMHISDAKHAMDVEPERYKLPTAPTPAEPEPETMKDMESDFDD